MRLTFTFHYGSTYIGSRCNLRTRYRNLHSTMVLLILWSIMNLSAMTLFTFHYGSTYMTARERLSAVILTFTFHYGSTYIDGDYITFSWKLSFTFHYGSTYIILPGCMFSIFRIYIPLWFYLYSPFRFLKKSLVIHLHSTMVLLIWCYKSIIITWCCIYIPLWFYLYWPVRKLVMRMIPIYIPLWFYLYGTFFPDIVNDKYIYIPLWFYLYGFCFCMMQDRSLFTFHYGSTYIISFERIHSTTFLFTFHYGSTYMLWQVDVITDNSIYIPLWFYLYFLAYVVPS